jgi:hypothetical protein
MPRSSGNDLCELFGFRPDDTSVAARKQWKTQSCPFAGEACIKHSNDNKVIYGSCSVANKIRTGAIEEVIICPKRLYAENYKTLRTCVYDALGKEVKCFAFHDYKTLRQTKLLPNEYVVLLGQNSGSEVSLTNPGVISLSLDWVVVHCIDGKVQGLIPIEVQSIDTTGNYRDNWAAYSKELSKIPDSKHGMNWANVWKRLIPQLILKSSISSTSALCHYGLYFVVPDRVYLQFEKLLGDVKSHPASGPGRLKVMTYGFGPEVASGEIRELNQVRTKSYSSKDFAAAFASGSQMPLGSQLDAKVIELMSVGFT